MQAREQAVILANYACKHQNMQLLDASVSLKKISYEKNKAGNRVLLRYFSFEFSDTGNERLLGVISMRDNVQQYIYMDLPEKPTITVEANDDTSDQD